MNYQKLILIQLKLARIVTLETLNILFVDLEEIFLHSTTPMTDAHRLLKDFCNQLNISQEILSDEDIFFLINVLSNSNEAIILPALIALDGEEIYNPN